MNIVENRPKWNDRHLGEKNPIKRYRMKSKPVVPPLNLKNITGGPSRPKITIMENNRKSSAVKKIDELIENIKRQRAQSQQKCLKIQDIKGTTEPVQNRLEAQKSIIEMQKVKLIEQEKIINDLKLGIITQEAKESLNKSKHDIREIFSDCALKHIGKIPLEVVQEERHHLLVKTQSAPRVLQQLKERELERIKNREMILERKRLIEEEKKRINEGALERKRMQDEEEKKRCLEAMKQRRKEEMERMKRIQIAKELYLSNWNRAVEFNRKKILYIYFRRLREYQIWCIQNNIKSLKYYRKHLLLKHLRKWVLLVEIKYMYKFEVAESYSNYRILRKTFRVFKANRLENIRSMQVAEDYYDFRLTCRIFDAWNRHVCTEYILYDLRTKKAKLHYSKKLLFVSFFRWKSLPHVLRLERAKEERKQKWRQKVLEILPDYSPPI